MLPAVTYDYKKYMYISIISVPSDLTVIRRSDHFEKLKRELQLFTLPV